MVWYKAWLETQFRLLLAVGFLAFFLAFFYLTRASAPAAANPAAGAKAVGIFALSQMVVICTWLGGAGIATQPAFQMSKGLYGSTQYTLSLPVSRFRLLAVRASLGWLEVAGYFGALCCGMWLIFPRTTGTPVEMFECAVTLLACAAPIYFLSVMMATFLEEQARMVGTMIAFGALWALSSLAPLPASVDIVRSIMGDRSPLITHTLPWAAIAFSLGLATILFFAALKIAQAREY
jgi:hypothetical protein